MNNFFSLLQNSLRLTIKAKPGMTKARAPKIVDLTDGKQALEIAISSAAEDGKANKALIETLAKALNVKKNDVEIKSGATARLKIIEISGEPKKLVEKLQGWLKT